MSSVGIFFITFLMTYMAWKLRNIEKKKKEELTLLRKLANVPEPENGVVSQIWGKLADVLEPEEFKKKDDAIGGEKDRLEPEEGWEYK